MTDFEDRDRDGQTRNWSPYTPPAAEQPAGETPQAADPGGDFDMPQPGWDGDFAPDDPEDLACDDWARAPEEAPEPVLRDPGDEDMDDAEHEPHSIFKPAMRKPPFLLSVAVGAVRLLFVAGLLLALAAAGAVAGIAKGYVETAPTLDLTALDEQAQTSFIYDINGDLITEYKGTENRVMVSLAAMPAALQRAFVAAEDTRFYTHNGVDFKRIVGAFVSNLTSSSTQGGSTITQQLIKNTVLSSEQSYKRKIQEAYLAIQLEQTYTKDQILECYLNTIWLGENYYGVQTASQGYFGKELGELTLRECAMLAGIANSPYYYNPRRNFYTRHKEGVDYVKITNDRTDYVLRWMYNCQFITFEQYQAALDPATAHVLEADPSGSASMYAYPHYVEYAVGEVVDILLELGGLENTPANRAAMESKFRTGGYRVQLAIDPAIQGTLEDTVANWTKYPSLRDPADKTFRASNGDGTYTEIVEPQAAAVIIDYRTGEIKAMVGSRNVPTVRKTLNRATDMKMPVGSSIKPLTVYAPALEKGASPASVVFNMPLPVAGWRNARGQDTWPKNYGGGGYTGPITLRAAMTKSYNTAAAQTMMTIVGVSSAVDYLNKMGVDNAHIDATPFGVTLGSSGITPLQMTVAYGVLANGGIYVKPISVIGISDSEGRIVWDGRQHQERRRVFSASTAYMIVDMLKSVVSSGTGTSAKISGQTVGGKTGTNSDQKGVTFAGITGYYASCVWIGHDNYKALSGKTTGSGAAAPLWQSYMSKIHKGLPNRDILEGDAGQYGLVKVTTCAVSGQLATDACYSDSKGFGVVTDYWLSGTQPTVQCQMHTTESVCVESGMAAGAYCPNVETRGVVTIPQGHPLYQYLGTEYEDTLREYLGLSYGQSGITCTLHGAYSPAQVTPQTDPGYFPGYDTQTDPGYNVQPGVQGNDGSVYAQDAMNLIAQAQFTLDGLDPNHPQAVAIQNAIWNLNSLLNAGYYSEADILGAMGRLSQAMAGIY
ncbi:MAG: PBP1A family penicillin-binding protein [Clostridia bacterium]|nr:PBP1A family penicillin-binding protein [Clostridia bacterium]